VDGEFICVIAELAMEGETYIVRAKPALSDTEGAIYILRLQKPSFPT